MPRYYLEVSYKGTRYSGFQSQHNANTIQAEVEKAFAVLHREKVVMTGSSRTDAGVHALQNYFHFDFEKEVHSQLLYKMNAILPPDIVLKSVRQVTDDAHCRFDALTREYRYYIYGHKDPFLEDRAYYFPYRLNLPAMREAAEVIRGYTDFTSFSKRNTQVKTFTCNMSKSEWVKKGNCLVYRVVANRFLRGMVRGLTATMLKVGRGKMTINELKTTIEARDCTKASFAVPPQGLFLVAVNYPDN